MDVAYDHIQEEALSPDEGPEKDVTGRQSSDLSTEFKDAYNAISSSPWGARIGGFFGQARRQSESYYDGAWKGLNAASSEATKGLTDLRSSLINHTRSLSIEYAKSDATATTADATNAQFIPESMDENTAPTAEAAARPESLPADIVKEAESMLGRFRVEAAGRLKAIQKAEDAADEALLKFGTNLKNFLRDAVIISPPTEEQLATSLQQGGKKRKTVFESKDSEGRPVIHATRFDASLYAIHSRLSSFTEDAPSDEYFAWKERFNVEEQTDVIAKDLNKYEELRQSMENLVPEKVEYADFWTRYYFLRHVIEAEEQKRRELLKGTQADDEEVDWGEEESDEDNTPSTPTQGIMVEKSGEPSSPRTDAVKSASSDLLKPADERRSNEHSVADSDASYDIVSGTQSRSPGSPKEEKEDKKREKTVAEESDEEDWE